ncbi:hypothetical protein HanXRQr2_Chr13g0570191 [Helianthus annuus]|uniref:Uncharacterized protein n=1 Tax=Helianthus annuus TaxID=4232 RepID=A0A9K3EGH7_HELAN|nr:hypothetical protein HanXRQr2_Chr13g0570191 [Helianthus annuus]KAJ0847764.1 hypothetical protein HanPSC8_Chr13g0549031 [Helianthus annuus]
MVTLEDLWNCMSWKDIYCCLIDYFLDVARTEVVHHTWGRLVEQLFLAALQQLSSCRCL